MTRSYSPLRHQQNQPEPLALRPREAAAALSISLATLDRLTRSGAIPASRFGRVRLYRWATLEALLKSRESAEKGARA